MGTIKEHGMLFRAEMVRALLDGRKTQTRRIVTPRNSLFDGYPWCKGFFECIKWKRAWVDPGPSPAGNPGPYLKVPWLDEAGEVLCSRVYSRVQPGDRIWARETWKAALFEAPCCKGLGWVGYAAGDVAYVADAHTGSVSEQKCAWPPSESKCKWKSPIHLPRKFARIVLDVTRVRVGRVQTITRADAIAEGIPEATCGPGCEAYAPEVLSYRKLWDSINGETPGASWDSNPWVWVYEFARATA